LSEKNEIKKGLNVALSIIVIIALFLAIVVSITYFNKFDGNLSNEQAHWGEFGDYIGGVLNPIFGFLALIALLMTISLQATELKLTREELKNSSDALNAQNKTLITQNFENSFFQMLRLHNDIVNSIDFVRGGGTRQVVTTSGRDCFPVMLERLISRYESNKLIDDEKLKTEQSYNIFYDSLQVELAHYFRYLFNIFKFIHNSEISNKRFYSNLIRAQLSNHELVILFYNCLSEHGKERFLPLAIEYAMFNNLPESLLLDKSHKSWLPDEAYAQNIQ